MGTGYARDNVSRSPCFRPLSLDWGLPLHDDITIIVKKNLGEPSESHVHVEARFSASFVFVDGDTLVVKLRNHCYIS